MSIFSDNSIICVSCKQRYNKDNFSLFVDRIGVCEACNKKFIPIPNLNPGDGKGSLKYILSPFFYNTELKNIIFRYKFNGEWKLCELFSEMLCSYLKNEPVISDFDMITSVPLSRKRLLFRGYNQSELIARSLGEKLNLKFESCVYRRKNTKIQSSLNKFDRAINTKNAFIADKAKIEGKNILLFDDIYTTGATMSSCADELIKCGASTVCGVTIAIASHHVK